MIAAASYSGWWIGLTLGFVVVVVVVIIVGIVLSLASRIADDARTAANALPAVRDQTDTLQDVGQINDSAISILRSTRAGRKALTGS